jgi:hypothetical protein
VEISTLSMPDTGIMRIIPFNGKSYRRIHNIPKYPNFSGRQAFCQNRRESEILVNFNLLIFISKVEKREHYKRKFLFTEKAISFRHKNKEIQ